MLELSARQLCALIKAAFLLRAAPLCCVSVALMLGGQYEGVFGVGLVPWVQFAAYLSFLVSRGIKKCAAVSICTLISRHAYHF